jgi:hypothetical protein
MLADHKGKTVIISGHSNTTPRMVNAFLGSKLHPDLDDSEYDWVYILDVIDIGNVSVKKLKIGI